VAALPLKSSHMDSGVLLKMEVGIRKGAWQRAWRYPAYLWSLRWVYAVKRNPEVGIRRIPPQYTTAYGPEHRCSFFLWAKWRCKCYSPSSAWCCVQLERLKTEIRNKRKGLLMQGVFLLHSLMQVTVDSLGLEVLPHPPYSPDLAPSDSHFLAHWRKCCEDRNLRQIWRCNGPFASGLRSSLLCFFFWLQSDIAKVRYSQTLTFAVIRLWL